MRSHIIQALIAMICAMAYTHAAVAEDKVKMRKCKSVKVAARASNKVYNVWKSIEHGKRAKPKKTKFGTFALLEHWYDVDSFDELLGLAHDLQGNRDPMLEPLVALVTEIVNTVDNERERP